MFEALRQHQPQHNLLARRHALGGGVGGGGSGGGGGGGGGFGGGGIGGGGRGALSVVHHDLDADRVWLQLQPHSTLRLCLAPATEVGGGEGGGG